MRRNQRRPSEVGPPTTWWGTPGLGASWVAKRATPSRLVGPTGGVPRPEKVHAGTAEHRAEDRQDDVAREEPTEQRDQPVAAVRAPAPLHVPNQRDGQAEHRQDRDEDLGDHRRQAKRFLDDAADAGVL